MHHTICDNLPNRKFCLMSYTFLTSPTLVNVNLMQMWTAPLSSQFNLVGHVEVYADCVEGCQAACLGPGSKLNLMSVLNQSGKRTVLWGSSC